MTGGKRLLVFFGMIASGKSYLAKACAEKWGCVYHNSDVVRKELAGIGSGSRQHSGYDMGIYSGEFSRRTYDALISLARQDLGQEKNSCVILDASYQSAGERQRICSEFGQGFQLLFIHCRCEEEVLKKRMEQRLKDPEAVSDGRWEIYLQQKSRFETPVELLPDQLLTLETNRPLAELVSLLEEKIGV
jgi:uncharacterized protein